MNYLSIFIYPSPNALNQYIVYLSSNDKETIMHILRGSWLLLTINSQFCCPYQIFLWLPLRYTHRNLFFALVLSWYINLTSDWESTPYIVLLCDLTFLKFIKSGTINLSSIIFQVQDHLNRSW